jgi:HK97 family phage major capsid protein
MNMDEEKLKALQLELKSYFEKAAGEQKAAGTMLEETKNKIDALQKQVDALDVKLAERHAQATDTQPGLEQSLKENEGISRLMKDKRGTAVIRLAGKALAECFERKTTISSSAVGAQTTGVLQIERIPGIVPEARQKLKVRDALTSRPTNMQVIDFVKVNAAMKIASPQTEASDKGENAVTFTAKSETVRTIATWIPASRQVLDDFTELMAFLNGSLTFYVNLEEELQLLSGAGTGQDLDGLITQATAFSTSLLSNAAGWNKIDILGRAAQQIMVAKELDPTFAIIHPTDWWGMRLQKDSYGRYILGDPQTPLVQTALFGLIPVVTTSIASGTFLVGSGDPVAAEIRDRMEVQVEVSTEHSDYFTKNLVAIRGEKRLALIVKRPASYITGTFTTSP